MKIGGKKWKKSFLGRPLALRDDETRNEIKGTNNYYYLYSKGRIRKKKNKQKGVEVRERSLGNSIFR